jgi:carbon storage regulator CsrA
MLVLTRKIGESVVVTGLPGNTRELKVSVIEIQGGRVRLGFEADSEVDVDRSEIWDQKNAFDEWLESDDAVDAPVAAGR